MNADVKKKWVEALRSGQYEQGIGQLRRKADDGGADKFCCLGVLCELIADGVRFDYAAPAHEGSSVYLYGGAEAALPMHVNTLLGVYVEDEAKLIRMNDGTDGFAKHTFRQIADYIEENL